MKEKRKERARKMEKGGFDRQAREGVFMFTMTGLNEAEL